MRYFSSSFRLLIATIIVSRSFIELRLFVVDFSFKRMIAYFTFCTVLFLSFVYIQIRIKCLKHFIYFNV